MLAYIKKGEGLIVSLSLMECFLFGGIYIFPLPFATVMWKYFKKVLKIYYKLWSSASTLILSPNLDDQKFSNICSSDLHFCALLCLIIPCENGFHVSFVHLPNPSDIKLEQLSSQAFWLPCNHFFLVFFITPTVMTVV